MSQFQYSTEFEQLIARPNKRRDLLRNCSFAGNFEAWEQRKAFLAETIDRNGSFIDVGCGNGFLLRCLQEWAEHEITPYGIDIDEDYIRRAKQLFNNQPGNFIVHSVNQIDEDLSPLPAKYDFVYFSKDWDSRLLDNTDLKLFEKLSGRVKLGGKLVIGFYGERRDGNLRAVEALKSLGVNFVKVFENPQGTNLAAWIELKE